MYIQTKSGLDTPVAVTSPPTSSAPTSTAAQVEQPHLSHRKTVTHQDLFSELKQAIHWKQCSAAFKAICLQTFAFAERALEAKLAKDPHAQVNLVLDIDDCLVECSSFFAGMMDSDETMTPERNNEWWKNAQKKQSTPLPGALKFINKFKDNPRVHITYLTSRGNPEGIEQWTIDMLKELGFPLADAGHVRVSNPSTGRKPDHVKAIKEKNGIQECLLMGDKLSDFGEPCPKDHDNRRKWVHERKEKWGRDYIVMPNPVYGMWENLTHDMGKIDYQEKKATRDSSLRQDISFTTSSAKDDPVKARETLQGLHYVQSPAYDAYMLQLSNIAKDMAKEKQMTTRSSAVVFDIDGTLLSNSPWRARLCFDGKSGTQDSFNDWAQKQDAEAIVGMRELVNELRHQGYQIYFVTNRPSKLRESDREETLRKATEQELQGKGFMSGHDKLIMREDGNPSIEADQPAPRDKASRMQAIRDGEFNRGQRTNIKMFFGDAMKDLDIAPKEMHQGTEDNWSKSITGSMGQCCFLCPNPPFSKGWLTHYVEWAREKGIETEIVDGKSLADRTIKHWHLSDNCLVLQKEAA
ncbi:hypothetical protein M3P05_19975 [Sansalvadorimonas sp. 2012CJ34-2]|uniref:Acid phosphatase n=1 Tax=Parendozoicomonas callyspongiae TaxID=2942213 RepID=A0ABT0PP28_9GAMM|nr:HAD family acid phosphatase [Sansalvadorimonas sp. 2012CJ34-2]MCL6272203.1 hypothetical protein [Sansalvadorimonas sp. 2012CJ34-2]